MSKKGIMSLLLGMFLFIMPVYAAEIVSVDVDADLVHIVSSGSVAKYCIGENIGGGDCYDSNANDVKLSSMNGTYYVWVVDANGTSSSPRTVNVNGSCTDTTISNGTGSGDYTRCFKVQRSFIDPTPVTPGTVVTCANGYSLNVVGSLMTSSNDCTFKGGATQGVLGGFRYCTRTYKYLCEKNQSSHVISPYLSSLSVSGVNLSPSFSEKQLVYAATVASNVSSVTINATPKDSGATYVDNLGPRTVNLNYGLNKIYIKVQSSSGNIATYTLNITRTDNRSSNNNLGGLAVSNGALSPSFNPNTINYRVSVGAGVSSLKITASLADSKSSFVNGYGPRAISLNPGANKAEIRVRNEKGQVRTYTLTITRAKAGGSTPTNPTTPTNPSTPGTDPGTTEPTGTSNALLKSLVLNEGTVNLEFKKDVFNYNVNIPYNITNILVVGTPEDETDTITVEGGTDLQVGENEIRIIVTGTNGKSNTYTLYVIRKDEEDTISSNNYLTDLIVKGKNIKFDAKEHEYNITIKEKEKELNITAIPADESSVITVEGNENLKVGSQIKITVTAEDGTSQAYYLNISGMKKSANVFLVIFVVLIIIVVIAYLLLRIIGYRIYFNFDAIKEAFKSKKKKNND